MIPLLETDETLFSWLARAERMGAFASSHAASTAFFGHPTAGMKLDFPSHLQVLTQRLPTAFRTVDAIIETATVLPYFCRFRPVHVLQSATEQMAGQSVAQLKFQLGLQASAQGPRSSLRMCRQCLSDDAERVGTPYWHRMHQLPGVQVCPVHGEILFTARGRTQDKQAALFLPDEATLTAIRPEPDMNSVSVGYARKLSILSKETLEKALPGGFDGKTLFFTYRHALKNAGLLTSTGRMRVSSLESALRGGLSALHDDARLCRLSSNREFDVLLDLLRGKNQRHPLPHLVLIEFLFGDWEQFVTVYQWEGAINHSNEPDGRTSPAHKGAAKYLGRLAVPDSPVQLKSMQEKGLRHRDAILAHRELHPTDNRKKVQKMCGSSWKWLYRNDREWLEDHLPPPLPRGRYYVTSVDWEQRDNSLFAHICKHTHAVEFAATERITLMTVLRKMPPLGFSFRSEKMPKAGQRLSELVIQLKERRHAGERGTISAARLQAALCLEGGAQNR